MTCIPVVVFLFLYCCFKNGSLLLKIHFELYVHVLQSAVANEMNEFTRTIVYSVQSVCAYRYVCELKAH